MQGHTRGGPVRTRWEDGAQPKPVPSQTVPHHPGGRGAWTTLSLVRAPPQSPPRPVPADAAGPGHQLLTDTQTPTRRAGPSSSTAGASAFRIQTIPPAWTSRSRHGVAREAEGGARAGDAGRPGDTRSAPLPQELQEGRPRGPWASGGLWHTLPRHLAGGRTSCSPAARNLVSIVRLWSVPNHISL